MNFNVGTISIKGVPLPQIHLVKPNSPPLITVSLLINQIIIQHEFSIYKDDCSSGLIRQIIRFPCSSLCEDLTQADARLAESCGYWLEGVTMVSHPGV